MTRLLVSVRDAAEARIVLEAGAHLIDVKEPRRGSLGAADSQQVADVLAVVDGRLPVSAALGELFRDPNAANAPIRFGEHHPLAYAKWGLAGAADHPHWRDEWTRCVKSLPPETSPVAVQYADWPTARSPEPRELLSACRTSGLRTLLIDTFAKSGGGLLDVWPIEGLRPFLDAARDAQLTIVLGGSLARESLPLALTLAPDYIAVRGAACQGGREGQIDARRVRELLELLNATA